MTGQRFEEYLTDGYYYGIEAQLLEEVRSAYQHIEILQHPRLGKVLRIDGALQCSEADEAWYHEPLVHSIMALTGADVRALIIGGGDGGAAQALLKWPNVRTALQVELDAAVVSLCRKHLVSLHGGLLEPQQKVDARYTLRIGDGLAHLHAMAQQGDTVDALILDLTDPGGPSLPLWGAPFFATCAQVLGVHGVLALHVGAPWAQQLRCREVLAALRASFASVMPLITHIPVSGGPWMMAVAGGAQAAPFPSVGALQRQLNALRGPPLKAVDAQILHGMVSIAHRWTESGATC